MGSTIRREIVSPEKKRFGEMVEKTRAETSARLQAEIRRTEELLRPDGGVSVTDPEAQKGRVLSRSEFCRRIKKICTKVWYEQSLRYPEQGAFYVEDLKSPYGKRMVAAFPHDYVFEFSVPITAPTVIPDPHIAMHWRKVQDVESKRPGWRVVLLKLLMEGLITATQAENEFQITRGRSSQRWQEATA